MNKWIGTGRIVADPETRTTQSGIMNCTFRIAVQRKYANAQGVKESDFVTCVAWRSTAEYVAKSFHKGDKVLVEGAMQNRQYDAQDGSKRYVTEIIVDNVEFLASALGKRENNDQTDQTVQQAQETFGEGFVEVTDDALPF